MKSKSVSGNREQDTGLIPNGIMSDMSHTATAISFHVLCEVRA